MRAASSSKYTCGGGTGTSLSPVTAIARAAPRAVQGSGPECTTTGSTRSSPSASSTPVRVSVSPAMSA